MNGEDDPGHGRRPPQRTVAQSRCPFQHVQKQIASRRSLLNKVYLVSFGALSFYIFDQIADDMPDPVVDGVIIVLALFAALFAIANLWLQGQLTRHVEVTNLLHATGVTLQKQNDELEARIGREIAHREMAQTRLARAERMEALGKLAGGVAHDFNNLLQIISSSTTLLQPHVPEQHRKRIASISRATERGARVVDQLLTFARRGDSQSQVTDIGTVLSDTAKILEHTMPHAITITCEVADGLPHVYLDPARLESVLINLAHNSRDAMPNGGTLAFRAETRFLEDGTRSAATRGIAERTLAVCLVIEDDGEGMDPITLDHATEPFFTTKPEGKGTGLGLSIAQGFVEQLGGRLEIASRAGRGTTVRLTIPASEDQARIAQDLDLAQRISDMHQEPVALRILLVENNTLLRELLAEELSELGTIMIQASTAAEALLILESDDRIAAVISDYRMPGTNGRQLLADVQTRFPRICAVLLTGLDDEADHATPATAGSKPDSVLRKPVTGAEIMYTVRDLVRQRSLESIGDG
ncbi:MAG: hypothetical protein BGO51_27900 [Rhodospirillales bacterium 69-11]|nr:response regulator [Rhodospirillales bacterium]OJW25150.1 MAG: hypothetical protein BGO51_27900 [Rhodospirillales bacterium 69-11]